MWWGSALFIIVLVVINLIVGALPKGSVWRQFASDIERVERYGQAANTYIFGDSRSAVFEEQYFSQRTLNLSAVSNTIAYSWMLLREVYKRDIGKPKIVLIMLGPNNYNKHGIFTKRDYALSQVATVDQLFQLAKMPGGLDYSLDGLVGRLVPVYGRRMEIRSPRAVIGKVRELLKEVTARKTEKVDSIVSAQNSEGMQQVGLSREHFPEISRSPIFDQNYLLTYKRSVYSQYVISRLHLKMLYEVIEMALEHEAMVILIQLPIEEGLLTLQKEMVGEQFDNELNQLQLLTGAQVIDLRHDKRFEFIDINHLSPLGAYCLTKEVLNPLISEFESASVEEHCQQMRTEKDLGNVSVK